MLRQIPFFCTFLLAISVACEPYEEDRIIADFTSFDVFPQARLPHPLLVFTQSTMLYMNADTSYSKLKGYSKEDTRHETGNILFYHEKLDFNPSYFLTRVDLENGREKRYEQAINTYYYFGDDKIVGYKGIPDDAMDAKERFRLWAYRFSDGFTTNLSHNLQTQFPDSTLYAMSISFWDNRQIGMVVTMSDWPIKDTGWLPDTTLRYYSTGFSLLSGQFESLARIPKPEPTYTGSPPDTANTVTFEYNGLIVELNDFVKISSKQNNGTIRTIRNLRTYTPAAVSPDKRFVVYRIEREAQPSYSNSLHSRHLFFIDLDDLYLKEKEVIPNDRSSSNAHFSADSKWLLFHAALRNGTTSENVESIMIRAMDTGHTSWLCNTNGSPTFVKWASIQPEMKR